MSSDKEKKAALARAWMQDAAEDRLDECQDLMLVEPNQRKVQKILAERWGVNRQTVRRYQTAVRKLWRVEGALTESREAQRDEMRQRIRQMYALALNVEKSHVGRDGSVTKYHETDLGNLIKIVQLMCQFDGLLEETNQGLAEIIRASKMLPESEEETELLMSSLRGAEKD